MENRVRKIITFLLLLLTGIAWGQAGSYYIRQSEDGSQDDKNSEIVQRFSWEQNDDVLKYEFTIEEMNEDGEYVEKDFIETENNWVEQTLKAGEYRYKIAVYNFLGVKEQETSWQAVHIIKAYLPSVKSVSPSLIYLEEPQDGIFEIDGTELREGMEVYLGDSKGKPLIRGTVLSRDDKNRKVKVLFEPKQLDSKKYTLYVKNIGGLTGLLYPVTIKYKKAVDFDVSGGIELPVVLFDETLPKFMNSRVYPLSVFGKMTLVPFKHNYGFWGIGLQGSYTRMHYSNGIYDIYGNMLTGFANLAFQIPVYKKQNDLGARQRFLTFEFHAGPGIVDFWNYTFIFVPNIETEPFTGTYIGFDAGFSTQVYFTTRLYAEVNLDYEMAFMPKGSMLGMLVPSICVGWQF